MEEGKYKLDTFIKKYATVEMRFSHYHNYEFYFKAIKIQPDTRDKIEIFAKVGGSALEIENLTIGSSDSRNFEDVREYFNWVKILINGRVIITEDIENN